MTGSRDPKRETPGQGLAKAAAVFIGILALVAVASLSQRSVHAAGRGGASEVARLFH